MSARSLWSSFAGVTINFAHISAFISLLAKKHEWRSTDGLRNIIFTTYAIAPHRVHGFIRDGTSGNGAAMKTMKIICQRSVDVVCSSHTACLAGNKLSKVALPEFDVVRDMLVNFADVKNLVSHLHFAENQRVDMRD